MKMHQQLLIIVFYFIQGSFCPCWCQEMVGLWKPDNIKHVRFCFSKHRFNLDLKYEGCSGSSWTDALISTILTLFQRKDKGERTNFNNDLLFIEILSQLSTNFPNIPRIMLMPICRYFFLIRNIFPISGSPGDRSKLQETVRQSGRLGMYDSESMSYYVPSIWLS